MNFYKVVLILICKHLEIYTKTISRLTLGDHKPIFTSPSAHYTMDNLHNRLTFDLGKKNKIFYYSQKEDPKISRIAEFGGEML